MKKYIVDVEAPRIEGDKLLPSDSDENVNQAQLIQETSPSRRRVRRSKKARRINSVDYSASNRNRSCCSCSRYFLFIIMIGFLVVLVGMIWVFFDIKNEMDRIRVKLHTVEKENLQRKQELSLNKQKFSKIDKDIQQLYQGKNQLLSQISFLKSEVKTINATLWKKWQESEKIPHHFWNNVTKKSNISKIVITTIAQLQYRVNKLVNNTNSAIKSLQEDNIGNNGEIKLLNTTIEDVKAKYESIINHYKQHKVETNDTAETSNLTRNSNDTLITTLPANPTTLPVNPTTPPVNPTTTWETTTVERRDSSTDAKINYNNTTTIQPTQDLLNDLRIEETLTQLTNLTMINKNGIGELKANMEKLYTSLFNLKRIVYSTLDDSTEDSKIAVIVQQLSATLNSSLENMADNINMVEKRVLKLENDVNAIRQTNSSCEQAGNNIEEPLSHNGTSANNSSSTIGSNNTLTVTTTELASNSKDNSTSNAITVTPTAASLSNSDQTEGFDAMEDSESDSENSFWASIQGREKK
ncbi:uncharacterized protein TRIADDRAFT_58156 [Trichoplax adhaerens]|uniref:Uncharacterized protein n=1 Tax=Trichoplax adhaerens TaxID=10228 RepID=B3S112_TRIAD|nr:hypothetical protein TRIADDRAFT_58156 [Trichoplax adhaerens]EDV23156.1 hypothetical protein TRIADDRAFT_58156 [Trichoplax adhaerens]|eukprot:XP_002114066.1 hypothetical protein TRIADDRAFT_58156 [Trichoplax adhaerens]